MHSLVRPQTSDYIEIKVNFSLFHVDAQNINKLMQQNKYRYIALDDKRKYSTTFGNYKVIILNRKVL